MGLSMLYMNGDAPRLFEVSSGGESCNHSYCAPRAVECGWGSPLFSGDKLE